MPGGAAVRGRQRGRPPAHAAASRRAPRRQQPRPRGGERGRAAPSSGGRGSRHQNTMRKTRCVWVKKGGEALSEETNSFNRSCRLKSAVRTDLTASRRLGVNRTTRAGGDGSWSAKRTSPRISAPQRRGNDCTKTGCIWVPFPTPRQTDPEFCINTIPV